MLNVYFKEFGIWNTSIVITPRLTITKHTLIQWRKDNKHIKEYKIC